MFKKIKEFIMDNLNIKKSNKNIFYCWYKKKMVGPFTSELTTKQKDFIVKFINDNLDPSGPTHFYLKGSQQRFTSKEIVKIFYNEASNNVNKRWHNALIEHEKWNKFQ